jgi:small subunit ribosomal protein S14
MLKINSKIENLRKKVQQKEGEKFLFFILNPFLISNSNPYVKKYFANLQQKSLLKSTATQIRTICFLTGRSRSIYRTFKVSRMKLKQYANAGYFSGLTKSSW